MAIRTGSVEAAVFVGGSNARQLAQAAAALVRNPCCSEHEHTMSFQEPDFLRTILADLRKLKYQLRKQASPATVLDGMELICGSGYSLEG
jgi:hypothetical protein